MKKKEEKKRSQILYIFLLLGRCCFTYCMLTTTNKQPDVNYTEYIQNETLRLSFDNMGNTSWNQTCSVSELPLEVWLLFLLHVFLYAIHNVGIY